MQNRAKCKLCQSVIESFHRYDLVSCKCGEISISGGRDALECSAKDFSNFLRIDDQENEIIVKVVDKDEKDKEGVPALSDPGPIISYEEKLEALMAMIKNIESLPQHAMTTSINHYDFLSLMLLMHAILAHKDKQ